MRGRCFVVGVHFLALRFSENSSGWSSNNYIGAKISTCLQIILFKNKTWNGRCAQSHAGGLQNPNQDLRLLPELSKLLWGLNEKCAGRKEKPPWMFCAATGLSGGELSRDFHPRHNSCFLEVELSLFHALISGWVHSFPVELAIRLIWWWNCYDKMLKALAPGYF